MWRTSSMRLCRVLLVSFAWAIAGSLSCLPCRADAPEKGGGPRGPHAAASEKRKSPDSAVDPKLRKYLLARTAEDQETRKQWIRLMGRPAQSEDAKKQIDLAIARLKEVDRKNLAWMKEVVNRLGWPGKTLVGADGVQAAWLLVQHADSDVAFQKRCLVLIVAAVKKGEATPENMAYLTDRVRVAEKKKQVYGTQFHDVDGRQQPYPIEDEANLDRRRNEAGLLPMAEYRKLIDEIYGPKPAEKKK
jgi:hypothetical protein